MHRSLLCIALAGVLCGCGVVIIPASQEAAEQLSQYQLQDLRTRLQVARGIATDPDREPAEWRRADLELQAVIADERFARLEAEERAWAWSGRAWAAFYLQENRHAKIRIQTALQLDPEYAWGWRLQSVSQLELGEFDAGARSLARGIGKSEEILDDAEYLIFRFVAEAPPGSAGLVDLIKALRSSNWESTDPRAGEPWRRLALEQLRAGQRDAAAASLRLIRSPEAIIRVRIDKRFDGLYDRGSAQFDPVRVSATWTDFIRARAKQLPRRMETRVELARELLASGHAEEALRLTDEVLAQVRKSPEEPPFDDMDQLDWIKQRRSTALERLGRKDESLRQLQDAATNQPGEAPNVSQMLDLAELHCDAGRGRETIEAAKRAGKETTPYGAMVYHSQLHCGAHLLGDRKMEDEELSYLRTHRDEGRSIYLYALLRSGHTDAAAAELIARLQSEQRRTEMLYVLQDFADPDPSTAPTALDRSFVALAERADVKAAVERYGRIESIARF